MTPSALISGLLAALGSITAYDAHVSYEVQPPSGPDVIVTELDLSQRPTLAGDSLAPCDYVVAWSSDVSEGGFAAYYGGEHVRYSDGRLLEYRFNDSPGQFAPASRVDRGVQRQAPYVSLLPAFIAADITSALTDSTRSVDVAVADSLVTVGIVTSRRGYTLSMVRYSFGTADCMPRAVDIVYNPGTDSESAVRARYSDATRIAPDVIDAAAVAALFPDAMAAYSLGGHASPQWLVGRPFPSVVGLTASHDRWLYRRGDSLPRPLLVVLADEAAPATSALLDSLEIPDGHDLLVAFSGNDSEAVGRLVSRLPRHAIVLVSARSLIADCDPGSLPAVITIDCNGTITSAIQH